MQRVRSDLWRAGFITNDEKSHWTPCQVIEWLGIVWEDSSHGAIRISDRRLISIADCVQRMFQKRFKVSARELASLLGKIISAGAVFGNISRIMTRYCSISVVAAQDWDSKFTLDQYGVREIEFWETNLDRLNLKSIVDCPSRYPGYQRFFSRCTSFVRPKAEDTSGEAARKTSGSERFNLLC